jgi:hypothetical protein
MKLAAKTKIKHTELCIINITFCTNNNMNLSTTATKSMIQDAEQN